MNHPTVSVVIPVYNGELFVGRAIESVLQQDYPAFEIIAVNDGSTDATAKVLQSYEGRIRTVTVPNAGVANARNVGIRAAGGELIAFLDADDIWHKDKLRRQVEVLNRFPNAGFCCCDYLIDDPYRKATVNHFSVVDPSHLNYNAPLIEIPVKVLLNVNFVGTASTVMVRKSVLDCVGIFNVTYKQSEDFELWLRCAMATPFIVLSDVLVHKGLHGDNLTRNLKESHSFHKIVLEEGREGLLKFLTPHGLAADYYWALSSTNYQLGNIYFNEGDFGQAFGHYWLGLRSHCSPKSLAYFAYYMITKGLRFLSGDLISRKTLERLFAPKH